MIFAVEIAFLFPWAIVVKDALAGTGLAGELGIGMFALVEGVIFIAILFLGLAYVWAKGDLDWVLTYSGPKYEPRSTRVDRRCRSPKSKSRLTTRKRPTTRRPRPLRPLGFLWV